ncbi:MAG TPA: CopD family protein [Methylomirabilota bacterium]|nr:CopD family protein [Methylomirabilota bacterium]
MSGAAAVLRWVHLLAALVLVGVFALSVLAGRPRHPTARAWERRMLDLARVAGLVALVTAVGLLALNAAYVAGRPGAALDPVAWGRVLGATQYGAVWLLRTGVLLLLTALLWAREREDSTADWAALRGESWLLAAAGAGALAWAGHAAAVEADGGAALGADLLHLVAAGAWLGALGPLHLLLRAASSPGGADARPYAVLAARRFSKIALLAMLVLVATGLWNAWEQLGDIPSLLGTRYGWLLLLKITLLVPILALAAVNRSRLVPALPGDAETVGRPAMARLARFVAAEWMLALAILVVVAVLGATPPGKHDAPWWPLSFRLSWDAAAALPGVRTRVLIGGQIAVVGVLGLIVAVLLARARALAALAGVALVTIGLWVALPPLSVDAYPTTYRRTTVPYQVSSIAHGEALYRSHCVLCHGPAGWGDGPAGAGLPKKPADLTAPHTAQHTAGDMYWWLTHGIPAAGMPAFGAVLGEDDRWDLINYIRGLASGEQGRMLSATIEPNRPRIGAPDAAFAVGPAPSRTLKDFRGVKTLLLVLYSLPGSAPRMATLARAYETLQALGTEVIAVPLQRGEAPIARLGGNPPVYYPVVTEGAEEIAQAYGLFRRNLSPEGMKPDPSMPAHMEFLIDRAGYLRARWIAGEPGASWAEIPTLMAEIQALNRETPAPPPAEHVH